MSPASQWMIFTGRHITALNINHIVFVEYSDGRWTCTCTTGEEIRMTDVQAKLLLGTGIMDSVVEAEKSVKARPELTLRGVGLIAGAFALLDSPTYATSKGVSLCILLTPLFRVTRLRTLQNVWKRTRISYMNSTKTA